MSLKVMSIDPGVTTGYTQAILVPKVSLEFFPFQAIDDVEEFWDRIDAFRPDFIVMESFEFRKGKQHPGVNLFPRELIGVAKLFEAKAQSRGLKTSLVFQTASQGKGYYSNKTLKQLGYIRYGDITKTAHGLDALRHLFQWVTFGSGFQFNASKVSLAGFARRLDKCPD